MRDSMIFYRSFYEAIKELPLDKQGEIYDAIFTYGLDFTEPNLTGISKTIWTLIKPQIDSNIEKYKNGCKPKTKQKESKVEAKEKQKESKVEANVNDNDNVNKNVNNIEERKTSFANSLKPFLDIYGKDILNNFYFYWTEHGEKDKKMRFEKETSFDIKRRLERWVKNDYNKNKQNYLDSNVYIPNQVLN